MNTRTPTPIKRARRGALRIYLTPDGRIVTRKLLADFPERFAVEGEPWGDE